MTAFATLRSCVGYNRQPICGLLLVLLAALALRPAAAQTAVPTAPINPTPIQVDAIPEAYTPNGANLPPPFVSSGFGIARDRAGWDPDRMQAMGVRIFRTDLSWSAVETTPGVYDFSFFDPYIQDAVTRHIRPLFLLSYGSNLYPNANPPTTPAARQAFANFAVAAVQHYTTLYPTVPFIWEIWNEPNLSGFWANPNGGTYGALALTTAQAIKAQFPAQMVIGPATATDQGAVYPIDQGAPDYNFISTMLQAQPTLLQYLDAISIHPYRYGYYSPETIFTTLTNYNNNTTYQQYPLLKQTYAPFVPAGQNIPIVSSEWGYLSSWGTDQYGQAQDLTRMYLSNLYQNVPVNIWYTWYEHGSDGGDTYGVMSSTLPKLSYVGGQILNGTLDGYRYVTRLLTTSANDYVLLFTRGNHYKLAVWTTDYPPHAVTLPLKGDVNLIDMLGNPSTVTNSGASVTLTFSTAPVYVEVSPVNRDLALGRWPQ